MRSSSRSAVSRHYSRVARENKKRCQRCNHTEKKHGKRKETETQTIVSEYAFCHIQGCPCREFVKQGEKLCLRCGHKATGHKGKKCNYDVDYGEQVAPCDCRGLLVKREQLGD